MYERAMRAYRRWARRVALPLLARLRGSTSHPRRQRLVLDDPRVTVLSAATLALIAAEDAAEARRG